MLGKGYVIEHCISLFKKKQEEKAYQVYMSDVGYALANMIGRAVCGMKEDIIQKRFAEVMIPTKEEKEPETEQEIIARISRKLEGK